MSIKYYIKDENNNYCDRLSIYKISNEYFYKSFATFSNGCRRYINKEKAEEVLLWLQTQNKIAGFNHIFQIEVEL